MAGLVLTQHADAQSSGGHGPSQCLDKAGVSTLERRAVRGGKGASLGLVRPDRGIIEPALESALAASDGSKQGTPDRGSPEWLHGEREVGATPTKNFGIRL